MHRNRTIYKLPEYQTKIRNGYKKMGLFLQNIDNHKIYIFRPIPNCPWLPESRKKYFGKLKSRLNSIDMSKNYTFATLTYSPRKYTPVEAANRLKHDLDLFWKRLGYYHRKFEFFYVIELTKKHMVHVHIIFNKYIPHIKLKNSWRAVTGCKIVHIEHIKSRQVFWYVTKYLNDSKKQSEDKWIFIFSYIDRIWTCSRNFMACAGSENGKYKFLFCCFDPERSIDQYFSDPKNDIKSNSIDHNDAILIAGFSEEFSKLKVFNQAPDWCFYTPAEKFQLYKKDIAVSPETFETLLDFYAKK